MTHSYPLGDPVASLMRPLGIVYWYTRGSSDITNRSSAELGRNKLSNFGTIFPPLLASPLRSRQLASFGVELGARKVKVGPERITTKFRAWLGRTTSSTINTRRT